MVPNASKIWQHGYMQRLWVAWERETPPNLSAGLATKAAFWGGTKAMLYLLQHEVDDEPTMTDRDEQLVQDLLSELGWGQSEGEW